MIDTVIFENEHGDKYMPYQQHGIYMKSHQISPPRPKLHRFELDGSDGELDFSEWAGEIKYESRTVRIDFRDMDEILYRHLVQFALGRRLKVMLSDDPEYYMYGRCNSIEAQTQKRVTDVSMTIICDPYKLMRTPTRYMIVSSESASVMLRAKRMTVTPTIYATDSCSVTYDGNTYSISSGTHKYPDIKITDQPKLMTISGSATLVIRWTDGVL